MEFPEGHQVFSFDDVSWIVLKYDDAKGGYYKDRIKKLDGTKAVDYIGTHKGNLYLIEVKDFREHRIENQKRLTGDGLAIESGQKVRDTVAGIIGAYRTSDPQKWDVFANVLHDKIAVIRVVVWLEYDLPTHDKQREKVRTGIATNVYKAKLSWLTSRVLVSNQIHNVVPDLKVSNLARPQGS